MTQAADKMLLLDEFNKVGKKMQCYPNVTNISKLLVGLFFIYLFLFIFTREEKMPDVEIDLKELIGMVAAAVKVGGRAVKQIFDEKQFNVKEKGQTDVGKAELLTTADLMSNQLMLGMFQRIPGLKVISEEKSAESFSEYEIVKYRGDTQFYDGLVDVLNSFPTGYYALHRLNVWVDPLDATQEYTEGLTEYVTTMACVTIDGKPVFGAIYRPFTDEIGMVSWGVYSTVSGKIEDNNVAAPKKVVVSRSHAGNVKEFVKEALGDEYEIIPAGGAGYKILNLVNNTAEFYIHTKAIKKWDLCAADAIIRAAGGAMIDLKGSPISYWTTSKYITENGLLTSRKNVYQTYNKIKPFLKAT